MSNTTKTADPTFLTYTAEQAAAYARGRPSPYPPALYAQVLNQHVSSGGHGGKLIDLGCGVGQVTRELARSFEDVAGVDGSPQMLSVAESQGAVCKSGRAVRSARRSAEEIDKALEDLGWAPKSVDMVTVAMAAHWFDMQQFWPAVAKVLKPGGCVAIWAHCSRFVHPSDPNAEEIQKIMFKLEKQTLAPYMVEGNRICRTMYESLVLPWDLEKPVESFKKRDFLRKEWNRDGACKVDEPFFSGNEPMTLDQMEKGFSTASMVTRWREAHPELAGTDKDCVKEAMAELKQAMHGRETLLSGAATVLLVVRKRS